MNYYGGVPQAPAYVHENTELWSVSWSRYSESGSYQNSQIHCAHPKKNSTTLCGIKIPSGYFVDRDGGSSQRCKRCEKALESSDASSEEFDDIDSVIDDFNSLVNVEEIAEHVPKRKKSTIRK